MLSMTVATRATDTAAATKPETWLASAQPAPAASNIVPAAIRITARCFIESSAQAVIRWIDLRLGRRVRCNIITADDPDALGFSSSSSLDCAFETVEDHGRLAAAGDPGRSLS